jgi:hypothetical protein
LLFKHEQKIQNKLLALHIAHDTAKTF